MSNTVIKVENLSKSYRLGQIGSSTISQDLTRLWYKVRGKDDPFLKLSEENERSQKGSSDFVWVLKDIDFQVKRGEVLGIIGKNGAGKSTLLKILSNVTSPTIGSLKIKGRIASLLEVGTGFHPDLTGRENIFLNGAILGMNKFEIRSKLDEIIAFSGVERYIDTPVKRYSSGMYVRLAFAVAAHLEPEILIVDEVLAVGDAEFQDKCIGKMQNVSSQGRIVLFVSHNLDAVQRLCSRGLVLNNGKVFYDGLVHDAIVKYTSLNYRTTAENLLGRTDRSGIGNVKFKEVYLLNENGQRIDACSAGDAVKLCVQFDATDYAKDLYCSVIIKDVKGLRVWTISSEMKNEKVNVKDKDTFVFELDHMPLSENNYMLDLRMCEKNDDLIQDWIENAYVLKVVGNDYFKSGHPQGANIDIFFNDFKFYAIKS